MQASMFNKGALLLLLPGTATDKQTYPPSGRAARPSLLTFRPFHVCVGVVSINLLNDSGAAKKHEQFREKKREQTIIKYFTMVITN